ncbi:tetracycline resistance efflux system leader peptide, partial [Lactobacillus helveticus]
NKRCNRIQLKHGQLALTFDM